MARRKVGEAEVRKLIRLGKGSIAVTLPIEEVRRLRWREKQKVVVRRRGAKLIIEDWS